MEQESSSTKSISHGFEERGSQQKERSGREKIIVIKRRERSICGI